MDFLRIAARIAAEPIVEHDGGFEPMHSSKTAAISPRHGDNLEITPISEHEFRVRGQLGEESGGPLWLEGVVKTHDGEFSYEPQGKGIENPITDDAYDAIAEIMNVLDPSWSETIN